MKISGFSFVRNGIKFDYPFIESIKSILPICDEYIIAVGNSDDETLGKIQSLNEPKISIIQTEWDESLRIGGKILAQQTDIALKQITGDWGIYLQADEVIHEKYLPTIVEEMENNLHNKNVEGLLLKYLHFYGSYDYFASSRNWYRQEIRIVRNRIGVKSWKDAQGFRINDRKMGVKMIDAYVFHYGWVKHPQKMHEKIKSFNKLWHNDDWVEDNIPNVAEFDYSAIDELNQYNDSHPKVMKERIEKYNWKFSPEIRNKFNLKNSLLKFLEDKFDVRLGEYKNFKLIK